MASVRLKIAKTDTENDTWCELEVGHNEGENTVFVNLEIMEAGTNPEDDPDRWASITLNKSEVKELAAILTVLYDRLNK